MHRTFSSIGPSLLAVLCWGGMFPIADAALGHVDAAHITAIRYAVASLIFLGLLAALEGRSSLAFDGRFGRVLVLGTAGFAGFNLLSYAGLGHTTPQHASLIVATMPVLTVLARWRMTGERPSPALLAAIAAAFAGVALVVVGDDPAAALRGGVGDLLVLAAAICWVRYTLAGGAEFGGWSPLRFTALTATAGTLSILAITGAGDATGVLGAPSAGDLRDIAPAMVYIVLLGAVAGVLGWNSGVRRLGPSNAALFMNLVPVTTFAIEAARGATPGPVELAGAGITLSALVAANLAGRGLIRLPARWREPAPRPALASASARTGRR